MVLVLVDDNNNLHQDSSCFVSHLLSEISHRSTSSSDSLPAGRSGRRSVLVLSEQLLDGSDVDVERRLPAVPSESPQVRPVMLFDTIFRNRFPIEAPHPPLPLCRVFHRQGRRKGRSRRRGVDGGVVM